MIYDRVGIEEAQRTEGDALGRCLDLLRRKVAWRDWPEFDRSNLLAATFPLLPFGSIEARKAHALRWQLFRQNLHDFHGAEGGAIAERIRADLVGLARLGSGQHILDDVMADVHKAAA